MLKSLFHVKSANFSELRSRLMFLFLTIVVFRMGAHIPLPGLSTAHLQELMAGRSAGLMGVMNMLSGGSFSRMTVLALGLSPYIVASLAVQMLTFVMPSLEQLKKEGEAGQKKITRYTRLAAVGLAALQGVGIATMLQGTPGLVLHPGFLFELTTVMTLTTGTMVTLWLGEQVTERGLGNGVSMLIFAGIVSSIPSNVGLLLELVKTGSAGGFTLFVAALLVMATLAVVVAAETALRKIPVNYARAAVHSVASNSPASQGKEAAAARYKATAVGAQSSHLPLKLNTAGVTPPILASMAISGPVAVLDWAASYPAFARLKDASAALAPGSWLHTVVSIAAIVFFTLLYTKLTVNTKETGDRLKKSNAFITGLRPGEQTAKYLDKVLTRVTLFGAAYISLICLLPSYLSQKLNLPFNFGGSSLLIIVVVTIDFIAQLKKYQFAHEYTGSLLKSAPARKALV